MQPGKHSQLLSHCPKLVWLPAVSSAVPASHGFQLESGPFLAGVIRPSIPVLNQAAPRPPHNQPFTGWSGLPQHST